MNKEKNCKCGYLLKEKSAILYCDRCKRVAFPYDDSKTIMKDKYNEAETLIKELKEKKRDELYCINQKRILGKSTSSENLIYETISAYDHLDSDVAPRMTGNYCINDVDHLLFDFFPLAENVIDLLTNL